jgi:hypothetical protein
MIIKASGRAALILIAGLLVLCASPVKAADGDDSTAGATSDRRAAPGVRHRIFKHALHHRRHYVHRRVHAVARAADEKAVDDKAADEKAAAPAVATNADRTLPEIPPSIANAHAQMLLAGAQISAAAAIPPGRELPATIADVANAGSEITVAASDQLSDTDRNLQESSVTATTSPPPAAASTSESSSWDQASLIGKIFIGFGALLTMASAARMFIT